MASYEGRPANHEASKMFCLKATIDGTTQSERASALGAAFETNPILRLVIRRTVSGDRSDRPIALSTGNWMRGHFVFKGVNLV